MTLIGAICFAITRSCKAANDFLSSSAIWLEAHLDVSTPRSIRLSKSAHSGRHRVRGRVRCWRRHLETGRGHANSKKHREKHGNTDAEPQAYSSSMIDVLPQCLAICLQIDSRRRQSACL
jgi:hypothetical protein